MSELDEYFGPREVNEATGEIKRTLFPKLEPGARTIADAFADELVRLGFTGIDGNGKFSKGHLKEITHGARDFVRDIGEKPEVLRKVMRQMRKDGLVLASPRSCIKLARQASQFAKEENRYTTGEYAEFIEH